MADAFCFQILQILFAIFFLISSLYGFGQHNADLDEYSIMMATKVELMGQFSVALAMGASKAAVALLLLRIINVFWYVLHPSHQSVSQPGSSPRPNRQKCILWFWICSMMFLSILLAIACFAQCTPVQSLWDPNVPVVSCPINLTEVAFVMCCKSSVKALYIYADSMLTTFSSLVRSHGLLPRLFPLVYPLEPQHEAERQDYYLCFVESRHFVRRSGELYLPTNHLLILPQYSAGVCGVIRTSGLAVLSETADYLCKYSANKNGIEVPRHADDGSPRRRHCRLGHVDK